MRKIVQLAAVLGTAAVAVFFATPAHADGGAVLTTGSAGGSAVAVGDTVSASLASGTSAKFTTQSGGSSGVTCTASTFSATVTSNPAAGGVASETLDSQTFTGCTSNVFGVTSVQSITVNNLPYNASADGTAKTLTLSGGSAGSIQATVKLGTVLGSITCVYRAGTTSSGGGSLTGAASNTDNSLAFTNGQFTKSTGPGVCPGSSFLTATYAPVVDTSVAGSPAVFLN
jgi:hypothetical protein